MKRLIALSALFLMAGPALAELKSRVVEYKDGKTVLEGYLAYDDSIQGKRPGVLVVHEWNGLGHYAKRRADMIAGLGYVAFAPDIYGKGVRPDTMEACKAESGKYYKDHALLRRRANAGLKVLEKDPLTDPRHMAAIGYCFGGGTALELARSGAPLVGVVSFHGSLGTADPKDARNIKGKVLVCQGGADQFTLGQVPDFEKEMKDAKVDYRLIRYPNAVHGFTNPDNKGDVPGLKYDKEADKRSWEEMKWFLVKVFRK